MSKVWWAAERQRHFSDSIDIKDVFQDYVNLVEFLISSGHLPLPPPYRHCLTGLSQKQHQQQQQQQQQQH